MNPANYSIWMHMKRQKNQKLGNHSAIQHGYADQKRQFSALESYVLFCNTRQSILTYICSSWCVQTAKIKAIPTLLVREPHPLLLSWVYRRCLKTEQYRRAFNTTPSVKLTPRFVVPHTTLLSPLKLTIAFERLCRHKQNTMNTLYGYGIQCYKLPWLFPQLKINL